MTKPPGTPGFDLVDDDRVITAFVTEARVEPASPFHTARALHALETALDADAAVRASRARWAPLRIGAVGLVAGFVGAASVVLLVNSSSSSSSSSASPSSAAQVAVVQPVRVAAPSAASAVVNTVGASPKVAITITPLPLQPAKAKSPKLVDVKAHAGVKPVERTRSWRDVSEELIAAGDGVGGARVIVKALADGDDAAAPALALVAGRFPEALDDVDAELAALKSASAMQVRCEQRLLHKRDREAVEACRAFGLEHPEHPAVRTLAFAAGRVAEDDVGDLEAAEEAYSRALLLSPFVGVTGTDALLARARVRAARDDLDNARADLRLYLHNEPAGKNDPAVAALASRLGL
jgi:hypothetical protein